MGAPFEMDEQAVRKLADILNETNLTEIEYKNKGACIRVVRSNLPTQPAPVYQQAPFSSPFSLGPIPPSDPSFILTASADTTPPLQHGQVVKSPMVGTIYLASEPGGSALAQIGDTVQAGQPLLIIEAMKVMNQIKSPVTGKILRILVVDGQPVEYDSELLVIEV